MMNTTILELCYMIPICIIGMFCWSVFIQGFWIVKTYLLERIVFLGLAFLLVNPSGITVMKMEINQHVINVFAIIIMVVIYYWQKSRKMAS